MKTKLITSIVALFITTGVFAQTNLNNYKYIIVPNKFDFLKEDNQYRLNELAQFLFKKYGFTALMEGSEYPEDLMFNRCLALRSDAEKEPGMFKTKIKVILKDCNDRIVYVSETGESRQKQFDKAYNESLRAAFTSFGTLNYNYQPKSTQDVVSENVSKPEKEVSEEIQKLKEELKTLKEQKEVVQAEKTAKEVIEIPKVKKVEPEPVMTSAVESKETLNILYAQEITNGFQLVDSSPKVIFKIKNTGLNNVFLVEGKNALIYKKGDNYILEHYENGTLKQEKLNIKF